MKRVFLTVVVALVSLLVLAGCGSAGAGGGTSNTVPPPQNLVGTFALDNGTAAVMDIQVGGSASGSQLSASATYAVTGTVRYQGENYTVGGLYDDADGSLDLIAENSGNGQRFLFSGTYTEAGGFSGTVRLLDSNGNELASGSASAAGVDDSEKSSVKVFVGTFGGTAAGTWNGTLTATRFYGTYADVTYGEGGSFSLDVSGTSVSENNPNTTLQAGGTVNGDTISGWWRNPWVEVVGGVTYSGTDSGSWVGSVVDSNYDPTPIDTTDGTLAINLLKQAFENAYSQTDAAFDTDGNRNPGDDLSDGTHTDSSVSGITATYTVDSGVVIERELLFSSAGYDDAQTGIVLSDGTFRLTVTGSSSAALDIDSDVSDTNNDTDNGGLSITYADTSTGELYVNVGIDYGTNQLTGVWEYDGTDYRSTMEPLIFGN